MLTREKPHLSKSKRTILRTQKWDHADEVTKELTIMGFKVHRFEASISTPHLRINNKIDYWPASTRFFNYELKAWGLGYEHLCTHLLDFFKTEAGIVPA